MRFLFMLLLAALVQTASAQSPDITLRSEFTGRDMCLDIVNNASRDQLTMAACGNYSGQLWTLAPDRNDRFVRLRTEFTGEAMCLDVINDGVNNQVHMARCANVSGQLWHVEQSGHNLSMRLWNEFTGQDK